MFPAFILVSALMAAIGATVSEAREGQQMVSMISLPIWIPYMLTGSIMNNPNSPLALGLSLFPLTAPLTMLMRDGLTILPFWQIALSGFIQVLCAVGAIWLAGRAFRLGMLRYGQRLKWREVFARQSIMKKIMLILKNEIITLISRPSFWLALLGLPLVGALVFAGVGAINKSASASSDGQPGSQRTAGHASRRLREFKRDHPERSRRP